MSNNGTTGTTNPPGPTGPDPTNPVVYMANSTITVGERDLYRVEIVVLRSFATQGYTDVSKYQTVFIYGITVTVYCCVLCLIESYHHGLFDFV